MSSRPSLPSYADIMFKRFPPRNGHILFPVDSRGGALAGIAMYPACAKRAVWFQKAVYAWVWLFGSRSIPWRGVTWKPSVEERTWYRLAVTWREQVGDFDTFAVSERRPVSRSGFIVLLVRGDRPVAFVKLRSHDESLAREFNSLQQVASFGPESFVAPEPLGAGELDGLSYLLIGPLGSGVHGMATQLDIDRIAREVSSSLRGIPKPEGIPDHWRPIHGDLTPWNLRLMADGKVALVDWEHVTWGPPLADQLLYEITASMITGRKPSALRDPEVVEFWRQRIPERLAGHGGNKFTEELLSRIDAQASGTGFNPKDSGSHDAPQPARMWKS